jgi:hypothetical protein
MMAARNLAAVTIAIALAAIGSNTSSARDRFVSDDILRLPVPPGWVGSVGPGMQGSHHVAWILAGDFVLPNDAASHEGTPAVPVHRMLISIGDFFPQGQSLHWPHVSVLREPRSLLLRNGVWWRVRFGGRALAISVRFGSSPTTTSIARVDRVLAQVAPTKQQPFNEIGKAVSRSRELRRALIRVRRLSVTNGTVRA